MNDCSRFVFDRKHYSPKNMEVKSKAFMPNKEKKTSVFMIDGLGADDVWKIGTDYVAAKRGKPLKGRGDFETRFVATLGLEINHDMIGHPKHANIEGWPVEKDEIKKLAQELASKSSFKLFEG